MKINLYFLLVGLLLTSFTIGDDKNAMNDTDAQSVLNNLFTSVHSIENIEFTLINEERIEGELLKGEQKVILIPRPFQCHLTLIKPGDGEEVLFSTGENDNKAVYEPNGFPYIQLELDPQGSLMRNNNHHTIFDLGFDKTMEILSFHMKKAPYTLVVSELLIDGRAHYFIEIEFINFNYVQYTIEQEENLSSLAERLALNDYKLSEVNDIDIDEDLEKGTQLKVPNVYAKKIEFYVDKTLGVPTSQIVYDEEGIYEHYQFLDLKINQLVPEERFSIEMLGKAL